MSLTSILFILTTFATVGMLLFAVGVKVSDKRSSRIFVISIFFWLIFTAILALLGFYQNTESFPPKIFLFGVLPSLIFIAIYFIFFREEFIEKLPIKILTYIHIIRIPVEMVLYLLYLKNLIPEMMTFEGLNVDILSGITAPIVYFIALRKGKFNRTLLIIWNILALGLLINIVTIAFLSFPSPNQILNLSQPNQAVMYFPYIWLPTIVVPIVLFSHLASLWKLLKS